MGRRYRFESTINAPRDLMIGMLTSKDFLEAEARENGALEVSCKVRRKSPTKLVLVLNKTEPTRDDEGNVVEGKNDHLVLEQEWDLDRGTVEWTHRMEELTGVTVSGTNRIVDNASGGCTLVEEGEIDIRTGMPFVGWFMDWFIAGRVIAGMKTERARRALYLSRKASQR